MAIDWLDMVQTKYPVSIQKIIHHTLNMKPFETTFSLIQQKNIPHPTLLSVKSFCIDRCKVSIQFPNWFFYTRKTYKVTFVETINQLLLNGRNIEFKNVYFHVIQKELYKTV